MSRCAWCYSGTATALVIAVGPGQYRYRAALTCPNDIRTARSWAARAGPVTTTPINQPQEQPQLF